MKRPILALALLFAGISLPAAAQDFRRIGDEAAFRDQLVGKRLENRSGWAQSNADGSLQGVFGGAELTGGQWHWSGGFWCRNGRLNGKEIGSDCQVVEIAGKSVRLTRNKGKGDAVTWTMK